METRVIFKWLVAGFVHRKTWIHWVGDIKSAEFVSPASILASV